MHVKALSQWLARSGAIGHAKRSESVLRTVTAGVRGGKLALTLGRSRPGSAQVKQQWRRLSFEERRDPSSRSIGRTFKRVSPVGDAEGSHSSRRTRGDALRAAISNQSLQQSGAHREFLASLRTVLP